MTTLKPGDIIRVKEEFELDSAQYTKTGQKLWSMRVTLGAGCDLPVLHASEKLIICRAVESHSHMMSAYVTVSYNFEDIDWDRVEIIKKKD